MYPSIYDSFPVIRTTIAKKSPFLRTQAFIFCLPWRRPCGNHAKRCMNQKTIQCLRNPSQHVPIYLLQFPSYSNRKCKKSPFSRTAHWRIQELKLGGTSLTPPSSSPSLFVPPSLSSLPSLSLSLPFFSFPLPSP